MRVNVTPMIAFDAQIRGERHAHRPAEAGRRQHLRQAIGTKRRDRAGAPDSSLDDVRPCGLRTTRWGNRLRGRRRPSEQRRETFERKHASQHRSCGKGQPADHEHDLVDG